MTFLSSKPQHLRYRRYSSLFNPLEPASWPSLFCWNCLGKVDCYLLDDKPFGLFSIIIFLNSAGSEPADFSILKFSLPWVFQVSLFAASLPPFLNILFSSVSLTDSSLCLLKTVIPKCTILGLLYLSLDILFLGDPKVTITIYVQMSHKYVISNFNIT